MCSADDGPAHIYPSTARRTIQFSAKHYALDALCAIRPPVAPRSLEGPPHFCPTPSCVNVLYRALVRDQAHVSDRFKSCYADQNYSRTSSGYRRPTFRCLPALGAQKCNASASAPQSARARCPGFCLLPLERHQRIDAAVEQLHVAIDLYLSGRNYLAAITLAGAADGQLGEWSRALQQGSALDRLKPVIAKLAVKLEKSTWTDREIADDLNFVRNWLKHYQPPETLETNARERGVCHDRSRHHQRPRRDRRLYRPNAAFFERGAWQQRIKDLDRARPIMYSLRSDRRRTDLGRSRIAP